MPEFHQCLLSLYKTVVSYRLLEFQIQSYGTMAAMMILQCTFDDVMILE